jgi:hypothetical protein
MSWMGKSVRRVEDERLLKGLALLLGDRMVEVLSREVERMANDPMPLRERKKRIAEIEVEIGLPPAVVLGVRVASRSSSPWTRGCRSSSR